MFSHLPFPLGKEKAVSSLLGTGCLGAEKKMTWFSRTEPLLEASGFRLQASEDPRASASLASLGLN
jgi:hypothetical protein